MNTNALKSHRSEAGGRPLAASEMGVLQPFGFKGAVFDFGFFFLVSRPREPDCSSITNKSGIRVAPAQFVRLSANLEAVFVRIQGAHSFP